MSINEEELRVLSGLIEFSNCYVAASEYRAYLAMEERGLVEIWSNQHGCPMARATPAGVAEARTALSSQVRQP